MAARYNPQRQLFTTPFLIEGWALYWEFIMWDHGFPRSPEDRVGMLFWRMHRAARIIFSLNFHLGRWTPQQCVDFLVNRVGHERFTAEGEVRRSFNGSYSPLYQVGYMMGALQIRSLMHELVDSKRMTLKAFNDAFLHEGQMPIEMMRVALAKLPLGAGLLGTVEVLRRRPRREAVAKRRDGFCRGSRIELGTLLGLQC